MTFYIKLDNNYWNKSNRNKSYAELIFTLNFLFINRANVRGIVA